MLGLRYDSEPARAKARRIAELMRDAAYDASVDLAAERGAFPLFNADLYLSRGTFASRLPQALKERIRAHGLRNSHLLSIAPTGTISLAFADNASNGIEPPFSWSYTRKKRRPDGTLRGVRGRGPRLAPVPPPEGRGCAAAAGLRHRAGDERAGARSRWWPPSRPASTPRSRRRSTCRPTIPYADFQDLYLQRLEVRPEGPGDLPAEQRAGLGARARSAAAGGCRADDTAVRRRQHRRLALDRARPRRCWPRCAGRAGPSCRPATRPGPT